MFNEISYYMIFGRPLLAYMGMITLSSFLITAYIGYSNLHGNVRIPLKYHFMMAKISLTLAIIHGTFAALAYF